MTVIGTRAEAASKILHNLPLINENTSKPTLDIAINVGVIIEKSLPNTTWFIDRINFQKRVLMHSIKTE